MAQKITHNGRAIFVGDAKPEDKHLKRLSVQIINKYGKKNSYSADEVQSIISFTLDYYVNEFERICTQNNSYQILIYAISLHEDCTHIVLRKEFIGLDDSVKSYLPLYRRILKLIIECVSGNALSTKTSVTSTEIFTIYNELIFIGKMMYGMASIYAENTMFAGINIVKITSDDECIFSRTENARAIFELINREIELKSERRSIDDDYIIKFVKCIKDKFEIEYAELSELIALLDKSLSESNQRYFGITYEDLLLNYRRLYNKPTDPLKEFLSGLILDNDTRMKLLDVVTKPHSINRLLCRPIINCNVDGRDIIHIGVMSWTESMIQIATNCIHWGKAPDEWKRNRLFNEYMHRLEDVHDQILENELQSVLISQNFKFDRNVKILHSKQGPLVFDKKGLGEIDFIVEDVSAKILYIIDCKFLSSKYDMSSQRNDFSNFTKSEKGYDAVLSRKIEWFKNNQCALSDHLNNMEPKKSIDHSDYLIVGIFIVNAPTIYMYNAKHRIYTIDDFKNVLRGTFTDADIVSIQSDDNVLMIKYPYFTNSETGT